MLKINKNIKVKTPDGFKDFSGIQITSRIVCKNQKLNWGPRQ